MKLLMLAASLRKDSVNKKMINLAAKIIQESGHTVDLADFSEFDMPLYNADIQTTTGFPKTVTDFIQRLHQTDGLIMAVPEYNFSLPGTLKNLIDWVSRVTPMPWQNQHILLLSASPSLVGGNRGLWHTRVPLEGCGSFVFPDMFSLAGAHEAFDNTDNLNDKKLQDRLKSTLTNFVSVVEKLKDR